MTAQGYEPLYELTRGEIVESLHYGALAVCDAQGELIAWHGDPETITYLRSSAKPFQALPFIEEGGKEYFDLTLKEIALMCASHSGTDEHVETAHSIQSKTGLSEIDLACGCHPITHAPTIKAMHQRGEAPTPNRHNCSGKHSGMLAYARMRGLPTREYIDPLHPIQQRILAVFAEMCALEIEEVEVGIDGCSAPNFAVPLRNAARGFARLCQPEGLPEKRRDACLTITQAMLAHPEMVGGPDSFDTALMKVARGKLICKGGAEGYQAAGILPGALGTGSPALGIAIKIADGDLKGRARPAVTLEVLRQLGALPPESFAELARFGPQSKLYNWRNFQVGEAHPAFTLKMAAAQSLA